MRPLSILALFVVLACTEAPAPTGVRELDESGESRRARVERTETEGMKNEVVKDDFDAQLQRLDQRIEKALELAQKNPKAWVGYDRAARLYMSRARLTGDYADYAAAQEQLDRAFAAHGDQSSGPFMTRAQLSFTLHRLEEAAQDFERHLAIPLPKTPPVRAAERLFAAELALQRGDYEKAEQDIEESLELAETFNGVAAKAAYLWKTGQFDEAEKTYAKALEMAPDREATEPKAWIHLQLGLMDLERGNYGEAKKHYENGLEYIEGYWLLQEHIAEILTLQGKAEEAKTLYLQIIERTNNPEFMDAMAGILLDEGKTQEAQQYVERAEKRYAEQMEMFPEAAYGHALEHYLEFGKDPQQTLDLAKKNHALRPNAEAKQLLAQAYLKVGGKSELRQAKKAIEEALAMPWDTADLHLTAAEVYAALGDPKKRDEELAKAKAMNPKVELDSGEGEAEATAKAGQEGPAKEAAAG